MYTFDEFILNLEYVSYDLTKLEFTYDSKKEIKPIQNFSFNGTNTSESFNLNLDENDKDDDLQSKLRESQKLNKLKRKRVKYPNGNSASNEYDYIDLLDWLK